MEPLTKKGLLCGTSMGKSDHKCIYCIPAPHIGNQNTKQNKNTTYRKELLNTVGNATRYPIVRAESLIMGWHSDGPSAGSASCVSPSWTLYLPEVSYLPMLKDTNISCALLLTKDQILLLALNHRNKICSNTGWKTAVVGLLRTSLQSDPFLRDFLRGFWHEAIFAMYADFCA